MVALRKDVKVGLIVGGITLAVVAVYVGLGALSGKPEAPGSGDASAVQTANTAQPTGAATGATGTAAPTPATPTTPVATAAPTTPAATPAPKPAGSDDVWANAFDSGTIQPSVTVTPSLSNPSREAPAKPNEVIQALTNPKTPAAPQPQQSASATDPSGSLAANAATPTLTRNAATEPAAASPAGGATHLVKPGETFSSIAAQHYGDASLYTLIVKANPNVDPGRMKPGVTLNLPAHDKSKAAAAPAAGAANVDPTRSYVVKPGDSLEGIASALYGDRAKWQSIYDANKATIGDSPARLKVGTVLSLPTAPTKK